MIGRAVIRADQRLSIYFMSYGARELEAFAWSLVVRQVVKESYHSTVMAHT